MLLRCDRHKTGSSGTFDAKQDVLAGHVVNDGTGSPRFEAECKWRKRHW